MGFSIVNHPAIGSPMAMEIPIKLVNPYFSPVGPSTVSGEGVLPVTFSDLLRRGPVGFGLGLAAKWRFLESYAYPQLSFILIDGIFPWK